MTCISILVFGRFEARSGIFTYRIGYTAKLSGGATGQPQSDLPPPSDLDLQRGMSSPSRVETRSESGLGEGFGGGQGRRVGLAGMDFRAHTRMRDDQLKAFVEKGISKKQFALWTISACCVICSGLAMRMLICSEHLSIESRKDSPELCLSTDAKYLLK